MAAVDEPTSIWRIVPVSTSLQAPIGSAGRPKTPGQIIEGTQWNDKQRNGLTDQSGGYFANRAVSSCDCNSNRLLPEVNLRLDSRLIGLVQQSALSSGSPNRRVGGGLLTGRLAAVSAYGVLNECDLGETSHAASFRSQRAEQAYRRSCGTDDK